MSRTNTQLPNMFKVNSQGLHGLGGQSQTTEDEIVGQLLDNNIRPYGAISSSLDNSPATARKTVGFRFPDDLKSNDNRDRDRGGGLTSQRGDKKDHQKFNNYLDFYPS